MISFNPITAFKLGPFIFYVWGIFVSLAFISGLFFSYRQGRRLQIEFGKLVNLILLIYLGGIFGSRLFFYLQWPSDFFNQISVIFKISQGGLMLYGGIFGGVLAGWMYIRKWPERFKLIDALAPLIVLCFGIGRIGCFLVNDHIGRVTFLPWAISGPDGMGRHPVALYLILFDLLLFGFLLWYRKSAKWPGQVFLMFLITYSIGRFLLDFTRDILTDPHYLGLSVSQWLSILILISSLIFWYKKANQNLSSIDKNVNT